MPVIARINVVLPAPFGPRRPVTPGPNEQLSSDSATFGPNHTDTSVISTVGSGANAGSLTHPTGGCAPTPSPPGSLALAPSGCPRFARSSFDPPVAPQQHADARQQDDDVRADGEHAAVLDARRAASRGRSWPRKTRSRRYSGRASTLISRGRSIRRRARSRRRGCPTAIDVTRNRPMTAAPATMRRSVSEAMATPIDGVVDGQQERRRPGPATARRGDP